MEQEPDMIDNQDSIAPAGVKRRHLIGGAALGATLGVTLGAIGGLAGGVALADSAKLPQQKPGGKRRLEHRVVLVTGARRESAAPQR
jgi:hypothetical protein